MTIDEAKRIVDEYEFKSVTTPDEEFMLTEAMGLLIEKTKDTQWMIRLGGYYYDKQDFDLALKYYEMADSYGDEWAPEGLGYIWYYGRTGEKNYEKAFHYYERAAANGFVSSAVKVADMYKNGYYVEQDYGKYVSMIEQLYRETEQSPDISEKVGIYVRLARIRKEQGDEDEALRLFLEAKSMLAHELEYDQFFGDLNVMKWLIEDMYTIKNFDRADFDLYDLYYLLKEPVKVRFHFEGGEHVVEAAEESGGAAVCFDGRWFRTADDFFRGAELGGERLPALYYKLYGFEVM